MRILLLGRYGQLGWELARCLPPLGEVLAFDYPEVDLSQPGAARDLVRRSRPDLIVNATAYTDVDRAEQEQSLAAAVNAEAPGVLAEEARRLQAAFIHFSTDYVFDGTKGAPYVESDPVHPLNAYGRSKLAGEQAVRSAGGAFLVFRTSWVYSTRKGGFVTKVLGWARRNETLRIVEDQVSGPTWARLLAEVTAQLAARMGGDPFGWTMARRGLYHLAGEGFASRFEWARRILDLDPARGEQTVHTLLPARSDEFPTPAVRPLFSALNCDLFHDTFGLRLPPWQEALKLALEA